ncbi:PAS domain-containing sensor histidine kinase [Catalinimonas niigatensis]|uniref:PAS domain-containing sensor histidine kinase n=1 Tax=Catalinimonas niigatensis TaxID=1397264 RepID=UPI0026668D36|nr:PAS domain-containing protein [Catalinimonas niigatensis]WPP53208.1 PAS domain-containing protein [Catalinimonas niigatensis]
MVYFSSLHQQASARNPKERLRQKIDDLRKELYEAEQEWLKLEKEEQKNIPLPKSLSPRPKKRDKKVFEFPKDYIYLLQATIENNDHLIVIIDHHYTCIAVNRKARLESYRLLGVEFRPGMDMRSNPKTDYPDLVQITKKWKDVLNGKKFTIQARLSGVHYDHAFYRLHFYPIQDKGKIIGAVLAGHDITREKKAQEIQIDLHNTLQLSNNKLKGIINGASHAIVAINLAYEIIELNEEGSAFLSLHYDSSVKAGDILTQFATEASLLKLWERALAGEKFIRLYKFGLKQGKIAHFELSFSNIRDDKGKLIGATMIARDVSKERQIEQELKDIKELKFLAENMAQLIWIIRADSEPEYFNKRFFHYTGYSLRELKQSKWRQVVHPEDLEESLRIWKKARQLEVPCEIEYRLKRASDQSYRWHLVRSVPMKNDHGKITHWISSATDIHERRVQTEQIEEKNNQLSRINQYLDDFVHATAHDLRVPVARLQLMVKAFQELSFEQREKLLPKIIRSVNHLDSTLRGLIQVIDLQADEENIEQSISLSKVIEDILERRQDSIREAQAIIQIYDKEVCHVSYVKSYLYTIIDNMISNAIKYRDPERNLQLNIHIEKVEDYCLLIFEDNGIGINLNKYRNQLFLPFRRISNRIEGLGLGLYVIQTMLQKNGGYIEVTSQPDKGSVFKIFLKEYC